MLTLSADDLDSLSRAAANSPRLRSNRNFHADLSAPVQRLAIAMEPGTYVRPHRHPQSWEMLIVLRGRLELVTFDEEGSVTARYRLGEGGARVFEMPASTWHAVVSLEPGSVVFEVKEGPYMPLGGEHVAAWSPAEGDAAVPAMLAFLARAQAGERYCR